MHVCASLVRPPSCLKSLNVTFAYIFSPFHRRTRIYGSDGNVRSLNEDIRVIQNALKLMMGAELRRVRHPTKGRNTDNEFPLYYVLFLRVFLNPFLNALMYPIAFSTTLQAHRHTTFVIAARKRIVCKKQQTSKP